MGRAGVLDGALLHPAAPLAIADDELACFVLNVGDGDSIVLRFPAGDQGPEFAVVDCLDAGKTLALLVLLGAQRLRFMVATHPHLDHIAGLRGVVEGLGGRIDAFWDSGFRYTSLTYQRLVRAVQERRIPFIRPTSGFEAYVNGALTTVLSPSIALRNRYDTYGVDANNASVVLRVAYPEREPSDAYPAPSEIAERRSAAELPTRTVILGGDAQTDAWGQVMQEFPHFTGDDTNWARAIGARTGRQPLAADMFKVSHHSSKRGVNLELLERLGDRRGVGAMYGPDLLVSSCDTDAGSTHGFPHLITQELIREVRNPRADAGTAHVADDDGRFGIHYTSQVYAGSQDPAGSFAFVVARDGSRAAYRLGDARDAAVDLTQARRIRRLTRPTN